MNRLNNRSWVSRRLGGSSVGLPDIVAVNNRKGILLVIEAKSGTAEALYVPNDQIERCFSIVKMFNYYKYKYVILAFKFMRKKRTRKNNETIYEKRKLLEYYKLADIRRLRKYVMPQIKCTYKGETFLIHNYKTTRIDLADYIMPFQKK